MRRLFFITALSFAFGAQASSLPAAVRAELKLAGIPQSAVAVEVREVGKHAPLVSINASRAMNPASTMKLLTTYAALDLLGPDYTWKTEAWIDGELKEGVLEGDLILKGYGDPKLTIERFWLWLSELRARGLREIRGDLVLDRSRFDLQGHDPALFDSDPLRAYNVGPDALLLNFNTLRLRYLPETDGLRIVTIPALGGIALDNRLTPRLEYANCEDWDELFSVQPAGDSVVLMGDYPIDCGEREQNLSVMPHTRYVETVFRAVWQQLGGSLKGKQRDGLVSVSARPYSTHRSEPLGEVIRDINKYSNNVMARQLFLTLGETIRRPSLASADGLTEYPLTVKRGSEALYAWMRHHRLDISGVVVENGAGLSRIERISAHQLARLLQHAGSHPLSAEFQASLPVLGVDGSVRNRLKDSPAASQAHLKTGTLESVKSVAGYVKSASGREWVLVFIINHPNAKRGTKAQDALIEWVQQH